MNELELETKYLTKEQLDKLRLLRHKLLRHTKVLAWHISNNVPVCVVSLELTLIDKYSREMRELYDEIRLSKGMSSTAPKA